MRRFLIAAVLAAGILGAPACGGYGSGSPGGPTASSPPPAGATVINIVGINGAQSFAPNPSSAPAGQLVVWHNVDTVTHRVVFNDGELDTGNIEPGAFSTAMGLVAPSPYHCSIHPPMIGAIVAGQ